MFNSYGETLAAGIALVMVFVGASWVWNQIFIQLGQNVA